MNKIFWIPVCIVCNVLIACSQISSESSASLNTPTQKMAEDSGVSLSALQAGYGVYTRQCYQCHAQPDPSKLTEQQWKNIVPVMGKHAGISDEDRENVLAYLLARKQ